MVKESPVVPWKWFWLDLLVITLFLTILVALVCVALWVRAEDWPKEEVTLEQVEASARTGDILGVATPHDSHNHMLRITTRSKWNHVALLWVKHPHPLVAGPAAKAKTDDSDDDDDGHNDDHLVRYSNRTKEYWVLEIVPSRGFDSSELRPWIKRHLSKGHIVSWTHWTLSRGGEVEFDECRRMDKQWQQSLSSKTTQCQVALDTTYTRWLGACLRSTLGQAKGRAKEEDHSATTQRLDKTRRRRQTYGQGRSHTDGRRFICDGLNKDRWYCSEFVAHVLQEFGILSHKVPAASLTPGKLVSMSRSGDNVVERFRYSLPVLVRDN